MTAMLPAIAIVFVAISVIFLAVTARDWLMKSGQVTIARKVWLRMSMIFAAVSIGLVLLHLLTA